MNEELRIKELEALINIGAIFVSCICNEDGDIDYCHLRNDNEYSNWYNTVEQALKRNEPMKVDLDTILSISKGDYYYCPKCGDTVIGKYYNYCPYCGQKLDWSDNETGF